VGGLGLTVAGVAAALPFLLGGLGRLDAVLGSDLAGQTVVGLTTLVLGGGIGAQFALAGRAEAGDATGAAARLYAADLFGAAGGALLASTLLIPRLGVVATCLLTAGLNLAAAALLFRQLRRT
jgi:predicted membrane-bound spermidine synthase